VTNGNDGGWSQPAPPPAYPPQGGAAQFGPPPGYPPYPPYPAPPTQPAKPRWPWIVGGIGAAVVLAVVAGLVIFTVAKDEQPQAVTVTYEVTGPPGAVEATYWGSDDNRSDPVTVNLPWRTQVTMRGENPYFSVSAERPDASDEPLTCRITADGKSVNDNTSISRFVSCHGRIGGE
jgi:hypothetical protein